MAKKREQHDPVYVFLGTRVRGFRKELGLTQSDLAKTVRISRASIANIELGKTRVSIELLFAIGSALNQEPRELLPLRDELAAPAALPEEVVRNNPELKDWFQRITAGMKRRENATEISEKVTRAKKSAKRARGRPRKKAAGSD